MAYARLEHGVCREYPLHEGDIRRRFPNTSFTVPMVPPEGYVNVLATPAPTPLWHQTVKEGTPALIGDTWHQQWLLEEATAEQILERTDEQAATIRSQRDEALKRSDWTQITDAVLAGVSQDQWRQYRQQLRDLTRQEGFPWTVTWPAAPDAVETIICDYNSFYDALLISPAYGVIRAKAIASPAVLTACVEFIAAIGDAKSGRPNPAAIQACVDLLCQAAQFSADELAALAAVLEVGGLDQRYTLPSG